MSFRHVPQRPLVCLDMSCPRCTGGASCVSQRKQHRPGIASNDTVRTAATQAQTNQPCTATTKQPTNNS